MEQRTSSLAQATRVIVVTSWVALTLGLIGSFTTFTETPQLALGAALASGLFVVLVTYFPRKGLMTAGLPLELAIIAGAVLTAASATLTGALNSPYLLMALIPTLLASMASGLRMGVSTSLLSAGLLASVALTAQGFAGLTTDLGTIALFPLLAVVVAQIRTLLVEIEERASVLEKASLETEVELTRLGQANELLRRLTDVYSEGSTNPVDVGRSAIEAIVESQPGSFATATLFDSDGPVVVARAGTDSPDLTRTQFPLGYGKTTSGVVSIGTQSPLSSDDRSQIDRLLRPVAVSFANAVMLQEIASEAVREERLRLARELHDEVGPALAALGFSLDGVAIQAEESAVRDEIHGIREGLGVVVDDLRGIIADLRSDETGSLIAALASSFSGLVPPPEIAIDVHERRPPRTAAGRQIIPIVTEAVRNAHRHSQAASIRVTGVVDRSVVELDVIDDGHGFDPSDLPDGHFGVMGMRERADRIGATVNLQSNSLGTRVSIVWKEKR